jgi:uncharacterized protein YbjT (DUF2867 family)
VRDAGLRYTFLRPGAFASNALRFWRDAISRGTAVRLPFPEAQQAPIDERDLAAVAVQALTTNGLEGQAVVLTGPASLTQREQLACIGSVLGRPIRVESTTPEEARADLERIMPTPYVDLLLAQWADEVGVPSVVTDAIERVTGRPATPYPAWVAHNAARFGAGSPRETS